MHVVPNIWSNSLLFRVAKKIHQLLNFMTEVSIGIKQIE